MQHISITKNVIDGAEVNSVNSRDIHKTLEVKTEYSKWIKRTIEKYGFTEDEDYTVVKSGDGNNAFINYIVTMETAKELCMVANTDKGRETRKYFIKVEKQHSKNTLLSLNEHIEKTKALFHTQEVMGEVITDHDKRLTNLEKNRRMESWQEANLLDAKNKKVYELGNNDDKLIKKLHRLVWSKFKKRFNIPRYNELTAGRYEDGLMWLNNISLADVV